MSIEDGLPQGIPDPCPYCGEHAGVQQFVEIGKFGHSEPSYVPGQIECHNIRCPGPANSQAQLWVKRGTTPEDQAVPNSYERGFKDGHKVGEDEGYRKAMSEVEATRSNVVRAWPKAEDDANVFGERLVIEEHKLGSYVFPPKETDA